MTCTLFVHAQTPSPVGRANAAPPAPQQVVMVIHRLSGWKLLMRLAANPQNIVSIDGPPGGSDVHTNIVAGFVSEDGRTVMARLPQAEAEVEAATVDAAPSQLLGQEGGQVSDGSDFTLVRSDGVRFKAKFIGLDASTGLSLLEASEQLLPPTPTPKIYPQTPVAVSVGQRIRLYAPAPVTPLPRTSTVAPVPPVAAVPAVPAVAPVPVVPSVAPVPAVAAVAAVPAVAPVPTVPPDRPAPVEALTPTVEPGVVGNVLYLNMGEAEGQLTEIKRATSGQPFQVTARANRFSPAWTGAVVTNDMGALVGIVSESGYAGTRILPAEVVRLAAERVRARRASVPQPWLGVQGRGVSIDSLGLFVSNGWDRKSALPIISGQGGVLLTGVMPETPAALGGLRPGDVITGIGGREIRGSDDFSQLLKEAGVGSTVNFKVLRPLESVPLSLSVRLSETQDPVRETRAAKLRAAESLLQAERAKIYTTRATMAATRADLLQAMAAVRDATMQARRIKAEEATSDTAERLAKIQNRLREAEAREAELKARLSEGEKLLSESEARMFDAEKRMMQIDSPGLTPPELSSLPFTRSERVSLTLLGYGLNTIGFTTRKVAPARAANNLLIVSVRAESQAAAAGLRPGDIIEMINGQTFNAPRWNTALPIAGTAELNLGILREGKRLAVTIPSHGPSKPRQ